MIILAAFATMLLGSCSKINERLDNLDKRVDGIENEKIASIENQITGINSSIADLGTIRSNIQSLTEEAKSQGQDITDLQAADKALGKRIEELEGFVAGELENYATLEYVDGKLEDYATVEYVDGELKYVAKSDWVKATFSTIEQYEKTCDTIAKIDARIGALDEKLSKQIADCADSLKAWVNGEFEAYYTAAEMDAKTDAMQAEIDSARAANLITDAKADSVAAELTKTKEAINSAKTELRAEYRAAIDNAITKASGLLTKQMQDEIRKVNKSISTLSDRVAKVEKDMKEMRTDINALVQMIQTVTIIPTYDNGNVKVADDTLSIACSITPVTAAKDLKAENFTILVNRVLKTKALNIQKVKVEEKFFTKDKEGNFEMKVFVGDCLPEPEDSTITVAINVRTGLSDFTTEYAGATIFITPEMFVDLGVTNSGGEPLFWATCNLGAESPEQFGDYYAYGSVTKVYTEIDGNNKFVFPSTNPEPARYTGGWDESKMFSAENAPFYDGELSYTKYGSEEKNLAPEDDAATQVDEDWRIPTAEDFVSLAANCVWIWLENYNETGVKGYAVFKAKNEDDKGKIKMAPGYSGDTWKEWDSTSSKYWMDTPASANYDTSTDPHIFLPAAAYGDSGGLEWREFFPEGYYLSSTKAGNGFAKYVYVLSFGDDECYPKNDAGVRYYGCSIRPVSSKKK